MKPCFFSMFTLVKHVGLCLVSFEMSKVAKDVLDESRSGAPPCEDTSWWNEEVKAAIKVKRNSYRDLKKIVMEF